MRTGYSIAKIAAGWYSLTIFNDWGSLPSETIRCASYDEALRLARA